MKPLLFVCLYICCRSVVKGQDFNIPAKETYSAASIARYVQSNFKSDPEKLHAIYSWIITNIRYDKDSMYPINWSLEHEEKISATLRRRRGVCENYATLFADIALKSGFPSFAVSGYTRQHGSVNRAGHSWCAVYLRQQWFLCDPTWDIGNSGNTRYFLITPAEFIESHIPFDPLWQLLEYPLTEHEFDQGFSYSKKDSHFFNFADSVKAFLQLDSLQQLEASTRRVKQAGIGSQRQKDWLAYNQMKIAGIYGEKDMNLYNEAVADLNKANSIFNNYVQYRNSRFIPARPDNEIEGLLDPIALLISGALKKLEQMGKAVENFQYDTGTIKDRFTFLSGRVQEQQSFLKRYLETSVAERERLFYK
ncbi:MAG: transglutaminase-like domain-containing protein [Ferruginibacter sp.]